MNTATKQFQWQNRDAAAYDLLQVVYHAPPYISRMATELLRAFRSTAILPQLSELVLDSHQDDWLRMYALRAYTVAPGNYLSTQFKALASDMITYQENHLHSNKLRRLLYWDLLTRLTSLADKHPTNREWFLNLIDTASPAMRIRFLSHSLLYNYYSDDFKVLLVQRLTTLLKSHPDLLDAYTIAALIRNFDIAQEWLQENFDLIVKVCVAEHQNIHVRNSVRLWEPLETAIKSHIKNWQPLQIHKSPCKHRDKEAYLTSDAYLYLLQLHDAAQNSDTTALSKLIRIAQQWQGNIPMRAVATYFLGQLPENRHAYNVLARQMKYGNVNWHPDLFDSPIRYEAGEALLQFLTPETWEIMVDSYFISPRNDFLPFQRAWIAHLTDVLSGEEKSYSGIHYKDRAVFYALIDISDEELARIKNK